MAIPIRSSEITPEHHYLNRRQFIRTAGILSIGGLVTAACGTTASPITNTVSSTAIIQPTVAAAEAVTTTDILGAPPNTLEQISNYNNFYEFSTDKEEVATLAQSMVTTPWAVEVGGLVNNPGTFGFEDLLSDFDQEERIYRLRCVEGWSMVIPWTGFPLHKLLAKADPKSDAKYVRFVTAMDRDTMPGLASFVYSWPYHEGLRLDEAMHDLTLLATGLYGQALPNQNGAPIRLVVPWKYGYKSIKSIVKIELVAEQPKTFWTAAAPAEYGFFANVNPEVDHPRWSQSSERIIGSLQRVPTVKFNGYEEEVGHLYAGMDLSVNY